MKKKAFALFLALALVVGGVVGGTVAWLTAKSDVVTNTFTTSDIEVKLEETKGATVTGGKEFKMVPGYELEKDPKAWVVAGSEDCYLFVKLDWANNTYTSGEETKNYLTWAIADGWTRFPVKPMCITALSTRHR
jgi:SipW-cognate class signal peptide